MSKNKEDNTIQTHNFLKNANHCHWSIG